MFKIIFNKIKELKYYSYDSIAIANFVNFLD